MALSNAERQRAYRARKRGEAEVSLEARVEALGHLVAGLEVSVRALEGRLRAVEDRPVSMPGGSDPSRVRPPVAMNPAMQAFVQQRPVSVPAVAAGPSPVDDWEPA